MEKKLSFNQLKLFLTSNLLWLNQVAFKCIRDIIKSGVDINSWFKISHLKKNQSLEETSVDFDQLCYISVRKIKNIWMDEVKSIIGLALSVKGKDCVN